MMKKYEYLLTYNQEGKEYYKWFPSEAEMDRFIDENASITVNEGIHIRDCEIVRGFWKKK